MKFAIKNAKRLKKTATSNAPLRNKIGKEMLATKDAIQLRKPADALINAVDRTESQTDFNINKTNKFIKNYQVLKNQ